jgi:hypothetical protein
MIDIRRDSKQIDQSYYETPQNDLDMHLKGRFNIAQSPAEAHFESPTKDFMQQIKFKQINKLLEESKNKKRPRFELNKKISNLMYKTAGPALPPDSVSKIPLVMGAFPKQKNSVLIGAHNNL